MADGQELIQHQEYEAPQPVKTGDAFMDIISQAVTQGADVATIERLYSLKAKMRADDAEVAFEAALAEMQPDLPSIARKGKSNNGNYATWEDIQGKVMPIVNKHGFTLKFKTNTANGDVAVTAILGHKLGHKEETTFTLKPDGSGNKQAVHAIASATSYAKRYSASALLNIRTIGEDDDGNKAAAPATIDDAQADFIETLLEQSGRDKDRFLAYMKVDRIEDITVKGFDGVVAMLQKAVADKAVA